MVDPSSRIEKGRHKQRKGSGGVRKQKRKEDLINSLEY